ncbi:MAG: hypothetical protein NTZ34_14100, partial [Chloroflexi bacterium]|nr:hypothetical protein [Chloroflexota bacterium]
DNSPTSLASYMGAMLDSIGQNTLDCAGNMVMNYSWKSITDRLLREFHEATALKRCHKEAALHR